MDVIISAGQGAGKTTMAMALATAYLNAKTWNFAAPYVLTILDKQDMGMTAEVLADNIHKTGPGVVIFDGCITGPDDLKQAIVAVKIARERMYNPIHRPLLAIYCEQHGAGAVVLTFPDEPPVKNDSCIFCGATPFKFKGSCCASCGKSYRHG